MSKIRTNSKVRWKPLVQGIVMLAFIPGVLLIWLSSKIGFGRASLTIFVGLCAIAWTIFAVELIVRGFRR